MARPTESSDPESPTTDPTAEAARPRWRRRRIASFVFAIGCVAVLMSILPDLPQDREVRLYLESPEQVTEVSLTFINPAGEPAHGTTFQYAPGAAQRVWTTTVSLPEGVFHVESRVVREERASEQKHEIVIDGDERVELRLR